MEVKLNELMNEQEIVRMKRQNKKKSTSSSKFDLGGALEWTGYGLDALSKIGYNKLKKLSKQN